MKKNKEIEIKHHIPFPPFWSLRDNNKCRLTHRTFPTHFIKTDLACADTQVEVWTIKQRCYRRQSQFTFLPCSAVSRLPASNKQIIDMVEAYTRFNFHFLFEAQETGSLMPSFPSWEQEDWWACSSWQTRCRIHRSVNVVATRAPVSPLVSLTNVWTGYMGKNQGWYFSHHVPVSSSWSAWPPQVIVTFQSQGPYPSTLPWNLKRRVLNSVFMPEG